MATAAKVKDSDKVEQAASDLAEILAGREAKQATAGPAIFRAMPAIMKEVGHIEKSRQNPQQGYKFRGIDEVYEAVQLVFAKHGVFPVPFVQGSTREERQTQKGGVLIYTILTVDTTFYAEDGSSVTARTVGEAMDSGDKSSNKAMSAAMKYAIIEALCIPTREAKDTEDESPEPAPRQSASKTANVPPEQPRQPAPPQRPRPWMGRLQAAVAKLGLGEAEAQNMKGKQKDDFVRDCRINYLRWCAGRQNVTSTLDLTDSEADVVIRRAELGEVP